MLDADNLDSMTKKRIIKKILFYHKNIFLYKEWSHVPGFIQEGWGAVLHVQYEYHHCSSFLIQEIRHVATVPRCNRPHSPTQTAITCGDNK